MPHHGAYAIIMGTHGTDRSEDCREELNKLATFPFLRQSSIM